VKLLGVDLKDPSHVCVVNRTR